MSLDYLPDAIKHLRKDRRMRAIIDKVGPFQPKPAPPRHHFQILTFSIVGQMLSVKAASTIRQKLVDRLKPHRVVPEGLLSLSVDDLKKVGLSTTKSRAMHDLANRTKRGVLPIKHFRKLSNDDIIGHLVEVHGVGRWTAEMFLMFGLVRPDVWPIDDLGIRAAIKKLDNLPEMPLKPYMVERGNIYAPYRTVASWYLWQSLK